MLKNDDYEGYQEALESRKQEEDKLTIMEKQFNNMQSMLEKLIAGLSKTSDQQQLNTMTLVGSFPLSLLLHLYQKDRKKRKKRFAFTMS
jgi:hypothetical protein